MILPGIAPPGLAPVLRHFNESQRTAWVMPRARLYADSLSHLRVGPSAVSCRSKESDPKLGMASRRKTWVLPAWLSWHSDLAYAAPPAALLHHRHKAERLRDAVQLTAQALDWCFP